MALAPMRLERLTDAARAAVERAFSRAAELRHAAVEPAHLLFALASDEDGSPAAVLRAIEVPIPELLKKLEEDLARAPTNEHVAASDQYISRPLSAVIEAAELEAEKRKDRYTNADLLLFGLLAVKSPAKEVLEELRRPPREGRVGDEGDARAARPRRVPHGTRRSTARSRSTGGT